MREKPANAYPPLPWLQQALPLVAARERQRLNQRLHDTLCQSLAGAQLLAALLARRLAAELPEQARQAEALSERLHRCGQALRDITQ